MIYLLHSENLSNPSKATIRNLYGAHVKVCISISDTGFCGDVMSVARCEGKVYRNSKPHRSYCSYAHTTTHITKM